MTLPPRQSADFGLLTHTLEAVESSGSGTTLLLLVAAALWLVYLVPLWMKRSEYYATEKNATRLGQTLRLLANTTEASAEIKAELKARSIARKEKEAERALKRLSYRELTLAERRRRTKQIFSIGLATGIIAAVTAYLAAWPLQVIWASSTMATISLTVLGRLNRVSQLEALKAQAQGIKKPAVSRRNAREWTPVALPDQLAARHLPDTEVLPSRDELLRQARRASAPVQPSEEEGLAIVSPFARMGQIDSSASSRPDLDEVLRRRRAV